MVLIGHSVLRLSDASLSRPHDLWLKAANTFSSSAWRCVKSVALLAQTFVGVLPDVCGELCCLDLGPAGRGDPPFHSQWDHHTFNWAASANQGEVRRSASAFKSSRLKAPGQILQEAQSRWVIYCFYLLFLHSRLWLDLWIFFVCVPFQNNRKMTSTVTRAAILLVCFLTLSAAQCK